MLAMDRRSVVKGIGFAAMLSALGAAAETDSETVFELRVYHATEGHQEDVLRRFREHTVAIFARHSMVSVAYWVPTDEPLAGKTLFYMLKHPSREAAAKNWDAFKIDPEWVKVRTASEANGKIVDHSESTFLKLTDFSPRI
jgi:hypothetical protein